MALKGNKGDLYEDVKDYFVEKTIEQIIAKNEFYRKTIEKAHSQIETREYFLILDIDYFAVMVTSSTRIALPPPFFEFITNAVMRVSCERVNSYV